MGAEETFVRIDFHTSAYTDNLVRAAAAIEALAPRLQTFFDRHPSLLHPHRRHAIEDPWRSKMHAAYDRRRRARRRANRRSRRR
ncbi:hypothetical protein [Nocardioides sp. LML1-1-1.1]|uniref:hypothetical protein n=1 Tax=Nocardioides sp. LML1-1-1.1 TaxID=3135248 RepID=UPI003417744D